MPKTLTERQQDVYDFIVEEIRRRGLPPTVREIMDAFEMRSTLGPRGHLAALEKKGHIRRHARAARGIQLVDRVDPETRSAD